MTGYWGWGVQRFLAHLHTAGTFGSQLQSAHAGALQPTTNETHANWNQCLPAAPTPTAHPASAAQVLVGGHNKTLPVPSLDDHLTTRPAIPAPDCFGASYSLGLQYDGLTGAARPKGGC